jgi:hypothetical protein
VRNASTILVLHTLFKLVIDIITLYHPQTNMACYCFKFNSHGPEEYNLDQRQKNGKNKKQKLKRWKEIAEERGQYSQTDSRQKLNLK